MIRANRRNFLFEEVRQTAPERNGFDLSHENKQTCRAGKLYPFELLEAIPGDDFEIQVEQFIRLQPMLSPTMHRCNAYWHWFFIPNRLCNNYWEEFISRGNGKKLADSQEYTPPEMPTISLKTLLYYGYASGDLKLPVYNVKLGTGTYDEAQTYFHEHYPYLYYMDGVYIDDDGTVYENNTVVCLRTPRIANALQIPDTPLPIGYIHRNGDNGDFWLAPLDDVDMEYVTGLVDVEEQLDNIKISLLPFIATFLVYVDYYRDENQEDDYQEMLDYLRELQGEWIPANDKQKGYLKRLLLLNYRCWEKDYFTTATILPQKAPDVEIPGTGSTFHGEGTVTGDVTSTIALDDNHKSTSGQYIYSVNGGGTFTDGPLSMDGTHIVDSSDHTLTHSHNIVDAISNATVTSTFSNGKVSVEGTSSQLQPTTVAQVRRAFALQRWFEVVVRTGTRYIETLKAIFFSDAGDSRLQRPEYIGGSSSPIQISDIVQTSGTDDTTDSVQGNLAGYGINSHNTEMLSYHTPEHGFILGMFSILARTSYSQGIPKLYSRETWLDYLWPQFEHIGEQGIRQKELAAVPLTNLIKKKEDFNAFYPNDGSPYNPAANDIFGYQSRYSEYKQIPDRFGSGFSATLDFWSLGRMFHNAPTLSKEFVQAHVSDRNFAVMGSYYEPENKTLYNTTKSDDMDESYDYDTYICDFWADIKKVTSLTLYSEPI